jgi:predicted Zn-dependent protease
VAAAAPAVQLAYEPVGLGWSADEVEASAVGSISAIQQRAERSGQLGCSRHCERLGRIFARLVTEARAQTARAQSLPWSLTQQGELEADELGLLLASAAGYAPDRQLEFMEQEDAVSAQSTPVVATHPALSVRQAQLRLRLPLARRLAAPAGD